MENKLIPVNLALYQFGEEDKKLASRIEGLKLSHVINRKQFWSTFQFEVNEENTFQQVTDFLRSVPFEFSIQYFRPVAPEQSVAGTTVTVQKFLDTYCFYNGSHGQDNAWRAITKTDLLNELFAYRNYQSFGMISVCRTFKQPVIGQKAY